MIATRFSGRADRYTEQDESRTRAMPNDRVQLRPPRRLLAASAAVCTKTQKLLRVKELDPRVCVIDVFSVASVLIPIPCSTFNLQLSIEDPDLVGTVNFAPVPAACRLVSERSTIASSRTKEGIRHGHRRTENSCHGVHQRTLHRFFQARQPRAHGERPEKNGLRIR